MEIAQAGQQDLQMTVRLNNCNTTSPMQQWYLSADHRIHSLAIDSQCITAGASGSVLKLSQCDSQNSNQVFTFMTNGHFVAGNSLCIDSVGDQSGPNTLISYTCKTSLAGNQRFDFSPSPDAYIQIIPEANDSMALDVGNPAPWTSPPITTQPLTSSRNQLWSLEPIPGNLSTFLIHNAQQGRCLDYNRDAHNISTYPCNYIDARPGNQQWKLRASTYKPGIYQIYNAEQNRCVTWKDQAGGGQISFKDCNPNPDDSQL